MDEEKRQLRQSADRDFKKSLDQLEELLEDEASTKPAATPEGSAGEDLSAGAAREELSDGTPRFGGSILDAIPLANRLGHRLDTWLKAATGDRKEDDSSR